jgi:molybdopterin-guanine dinucleotide biosynthesis protein A
MFGSESMLARTLRVVSSVASEVWIVACEGQAVAGATAPDAWDAKGRMPSAPPYPRIVRDPADGLGPLAAVARGLAVLESPHAFVTGCDAPLLQPALIRRMLELAEGYDCAVPRIEGRWMPLCAVYDRRLAARAQCLVDAGERRASALATTSHTRELRAEDLSACDPELESFMSCNSPEEYAALLARARAEAIRAPG